MDTALMMIAAGAVLVGSVALGRHLARRERRHDVEWIERVHACFAEVGRRRGLTVHLIPPHAHPIAGEIPIPPRLRGAVDGILVELAIESETAVEAGEDWMVLRLRPPSSGPEWRQLDAVRGTPLQPSGLAALEALRSSSERVELTARGLVATPAVAAARDGSGRVRRLEIDPDRLDAWLGTALALARAVV